MHSKNAHHGTGHFIKNNYIICTMEDDILKDEEGSEEDDLDLKPSHDIKKSGDILDEEVDSIDDLADDELEIAKEDLMDDVEEM
ncbi:MAG: hypothetical protein UV81_C0007G0005 [Candidatus Azambacteria bacterium GW2011_GWD1_43_18]|nr:MAG: hypothetical protein UV81_C0007G0005 [Candidatus Azambacteria bacterium GW2011_GWD1_43_18]